MLNFSEYVSESTGPEQAKYHKGVEDEEDERVDQFKKQAKMDDDDPEAYKDAPGDKEAREKGIPKSKHTKNYEKMFLGEKKTSNKAIIKKAKETGISYLILKQVYDRGVAAWKTGHRPGTTPQQWGMARINSFVTGGKTRRTADRDLWKKHLANKRKKKKAKSEETIAEAKYQGKTVKLNDPIRNSSGKKKFRVYTTHPKTGNVIKVQFGDPGLSIKRDSDKRRKAFRARHGCDAVTYEDDRHTPKYWSCKMWEKDKKVSELD